VGAAEDCNQVTFTGNTVARSARNGVNLAGVTNWNISGNTVLDNGQSLVGRYRCGVLLENDHLSQQPCAHINIVGNTSQNTGALTTQECGFVVAGDGDKIALVGNCAENGLIYPYSVGASVTSLTMFGNRGGGVGFTSINLVPGASVDADHATGFRIGSDGGRKIGFWGGPRSGSRPRLRQTPPTSPQLLRWSTT
jgi:parallel beta-helix repeat protein